MSNMVGEGVEESCVAAYWFNSPVYHLVYN